MYPFSPQRILCTTTLATYFKWSTNLILTQNEVCVVTQVSTFLIITQVSSGLRKSHILMIIFNKCKYLHVKIASLGTDFDFILKCSSGALYKG